MKHFFKIMFSSFSSSIPYQIFIILLHFLIYSSTMHKMKEKIENKIAQQQQPKQSNSMAFASALAPFLVVKATRADATEIHEFLISDFLIREPLNVAIELQTEKNDALFADLLKNAFNDGLSYIVRDPAQNGRIIAVRLARIDQRKEGGGTVDAEGKEVLKHLNNKFMEMGDGNMPSSAGVEGNKKIEKIGKLLHVLKENTWKRLPATINRLAHWMVISVSADYASRGIAGALLQHNLEEAKALGCQGIVAEATAFKSQNLFKKLGYTRLFELPHAKWLDSKTGKPIFQCADGTDRVTLEFMAFNKNVDKLKTI